MPKLTGQSIGRYHILEQLGEGGMATVYKAYDTRLERNVAVKVLRTDLFGSAIIEQILKRFEREAKSLAKLSHSNIVNILDYGEHEGSPYLVMEYLPGGTLKQKLGQAIPCQEAIQTLLPVARGLAYAHQHGVIHRDVKPANILMKEGNVPVLTDFGIAKLLEGADGHTLTASGVGIGTPEYMAPEQGIGAHTIDARADIYSLGIVLYEMVTGRKPYIADTPMAVVLKQMTDPLPRPTDFVPDLPEGVERILFKALAKQPDDRYADMNTLIAAMDGVLSDAKEVEVLAPPKLLKKKVLPRIKPSPKMVMAVIGTMAVILIIIFGEPLGKLQFFPTPTVSATSTSTFAVIPPSATLESSPTQTLTRTPQPTPIATSSPTQKASTFYEPILAYTDTKRPSFEDDFSTQKTIWGITTRGNWISNFTRDQSLHIPTRSRKLPSNTLLYSDDFVMSYDYAMATGSVIGFVFRSSPDESAYYKFIYYQGGDWTFRNNDGIKSTDVGSGNFRPVAGSEVAFLEEEPNWIRIPLNNFLFIVYKENLVVLVNGDLILEYNELAHYGDGNFLLNIEESWLGKLDNVKFWNISGVDFTQ